MYCSNCGSQMKETDIFCSKCGHKQGNEIKTKEPPKEEVVFNTPSQKDKLISFAEEESPWDNWDNNERKSEAIFRAPDQAHQSVNNARKPEVDDFVWNVHDFPEPGPRPTEDIDFRWDEEIQPRSQRFTRPTTPPREDFAGDSKFHTYNKTREEFQQLLDKEYIRQNKEPEYPLEKDSQEHPSYDSMGNIEIIDKQPEENPEHYKSPEHHQEDDFDIKKTRFFQEKDWETPTTISLNTTVASSIPPVVDRDYTKDYINPPTSSSPKCTEPQEPSSIADVMGNLHIVEPAMAEAPDKAEDEHTITPLTEMPSETTLRAEDSAEALGALERVEGGDFERGQALAAEAAKVPTPGIDEKLAKLWDSDTAPLPVAYLGLGAKSIRAEKAKATDLEDEKDLGKVKNQEDSEGTEEPKDTEDPLSTYDPLDDIYEGEDAKDGRKGGFFGKFIIAIIIIILIIEGSILGLRNFAPESEATAKANQVILTIQNWVEDTFFDKK